MQFKKLKKKMIISIIVGFGIMVAILMLSDIREMEKVLQRIDYRYVPTILLLIPINYVIRFLKYSYYLDIVGVRAGLRDKIIILISSFSMTISPAKLGEMAIKSYMLKKKYDVPYSVTVPLVGAERLTDGIGMHILAFIGLVSFEYGTTLLIVVSCVLCAGIAVIQCRRLCYFILYRLKKVLLIGKHIEKFIIFYESAYSVLRFRPLLAGILSGMAAWTCEGAVLYLSVRALGGQLPFLQAIFIISFSSIVGAISMLPGGLVAIDGTVLSLMISMGVSKTISSAATLVSRFSTLWLGVIAGIVALIVAEKVGLFDSNDRIELEEHV